MLIHIYWVKRFEKCSFIRETMTNKTYKLQFLNIDYPQILLMNFPFLAGTKYTNQAFLKISKSCRIPLHLFSLLKSQRMYKENLPSRSLVNTCIEGYYKYSESIKLPKMDSLQRVPTHKVEDTWLLPFLYSFKWDGFDWIRKILMLYPMVWTWQVV